MTPALFACLGALLWALLGFDAAIRGDPIHRDYLREWAVMLALTAFFILLGLG